MSEEIVTVAIAYACAAAFFFSVFMLLFKIRWKRSENGDPIVILAMSILWPMTTIFVYGLWLDEEERRRDELAREVMES